MNNTQGRINELVSAPIKIEDKKSNGNVKRLNRILDCLKIVILYSSI